MSEETELGLGDRVGDGLEVVEVLGRGGFAIVYEVTRGAQRLAMKVMKRKHIAKKDTVARFFREAEVVRGLNSPHLPKIHDVGELPDGRPYILMDRLVGRSVRDALRADGPFDAARVARLGSQACLALTQAHERGALHRDLKPANLFLVDEGDDELLMVLDFGVATFVAGFTDRYGALTRTNAIVGTPHYMSPEQIRASPLDARSDVYMLGAVLYELLTGKRPFEGETLGLLLAAVHAGVYDPVPRYAPTTPKALVAIIDKALSHQPDDRFSSALYMGKALEVAESAPLEVAPRPSARPTMPGRPAASAAPTPATRDDTPDRLPPRANASAESTESVAPIPRPSLRLPAFLFVLALIAIGGVVVHWMSQPDTEAEVTPAAQDVVVNDPEPESAPSEIPTGFTPTETVQPPSMPASMTTVMSAPRTARVPMAMRSTPIGPTEPIEPAEPIETMMHEATMAAPLSADMRGDLLDPFGP